MIPTGLQDHLDTRTTTLCRAWTVTRLDGQVLGFTDHDRDLVIDGVVHRAGSGLTARALQQSTGLSVDNTEAVGALSAAAISETDLAAGRYDAAVVRVWLINWANDADWVELFRGTLGEVTRLGSEFRAELRGLAEGLNQPVGVAYTRGCSAVLGDDRCGFDVTQPGYFTDRVVEDIDSENRTFRFAEFGGFDDRWFEFGRVDVMSGAASGLVGMVKSDRIDGAGRNVALWHRLRATIAAGDLVRFTVGCDNRATSCRLKFGNLANFRGFPHIPGEDWLTSYPGATGQTERGGSLFPVAGA